MALSFGTDLDDVTADEAELSALLETARAREQAAADAGEAEDYGIFDGDFETDPDPGFGGEGLEDRIIPDSVFDPPKGRAPAARLRKDIKAKTAMFLMVGGKAWKARDQYCGEVFVEQIPEISDKLAEIFLDSPDVVRWFTASGKWMKWMDLAVAFQPVLEAAFAHHVTHSADVDRAEPDWSAYAVG